MEWNLQLANVSLCQKGRWYHYCMWRISLLCGSGIVNDVTKVGHAQKIYYQWIVLQCLNHTSTYPRNLISLAIFNTIFWQIGGGLLFWATPYNTPSAIHIPIVHCAVCHLFNKRIHDVTKCIPDLLVICLYTVSQKCHYLNRE